MADRRRDSGRPEGAARGATAEKHGWLRFDSYQSIHERALERHHFVVEDGTTFRRDTGSGVTIYVLEGAIHCQAEVVIQVTKSLAVRVFRGREQVRGLRYRYHAHQLGGFNILRYDNMHVGAPDEFHRHEFDPANGDARRVTLITREEMPTLIEFVSEVEALARAARLL